MPVVDFLPYVALIVTAFLAWSASKGNHNKNLTNLQVNTIFALQARVDVLEKQNAEQQKEIDGLKSENQVLRDLVKEKT